MAKTKLHFLCSACGGVQPKWMGKCPDCGGWDTLQEYREQTEDPRRPTEAGDTPAEAEPVSAPVVKGRLVRMASGIGEFDRILGGGIVPGSVTLVGGEPGIGKSTLLLQAAAALAGKGHGVIYATSEESADQTRLRAERLNVKSNENLRVLAEANIERISQQVRKHKPKVLVLDSIQMAYKPDLPAAPGSVTQLREGTMMLTTLAKTMGVSVLLVGHVTKQGVLAGPKLLEHVVDTVVYFEGDRYHAHRIVRCIKNRFGSTHEVGLFRMASAGLEEITDPSNLFTDHHGGGPPPSGSILTAALSGNRVLLLEVQALTASSVIGAARRKVSGVSADRVAMIIAVLEKRAELRLAADDVFVNIAGGVKIPEPALDLPIALAIASAHANRPFPAGTLALGELGLGGEVRAISQLDQRLREASRLGIANAIVPPMPERIPKLGGMAIQEVRRLSAALQAM